MRDRGVFNIARALPRMVCLAVLHGAHALGYVLIMARAGPRKICTTSGCGPKGLKSLIYHLNARMTRYTPSAGGPRPSCARTMGTTFLSRFSSGGTSLQRCLMCVRSELREGRGMIWGCWRIMHGGRRRRRITRGRWTRRAWRLLGV